MEDLSYPKISSDSTSSPYSLALYFHIPFCRHACSYCDFFFVVDKHKQKDFFSALTTELKLYQKYILPSSTVVTSIYFGGGTPSWVDPKYLETILAEVRATFPLQPENSLIEITLEANPDDLSETSLLCYEAAGVNRISVGIQAFYEPALNYLERTHNRDHAVNALHLINQHYREGRLASWSMDLIYGIPGLNTEKWQEQLGKALEFSPPHLSLYALTVEPQTPLAYHIAKKKKLHPAEDYIQEQFLIASEYLRKCGYDHYEISNFSLLGHYAQHNLGYWGYQEYLGLGPGAHSLIEGKRFYNLPKLQSYIKFFNGLDLDELKKLKGSAVEREFNDRLHPVRKVEVLTATAKFNEYLLVRLRTKWGVHLGKLEKLFPEFDFREEVQQKINLYIAKAWMEQRGEEIFLTSSGRMVSDYICREIFRTEPTDTISP